MTDPIVWRVLTQIQDTIRGMRRADGYWFEPKPTSVVVDLVDWSLMPDAALPLFIVVLETRFAEREFLPARVLRERVALQVVGIVLADGPRVDERMRAAVRASADIERALAVDLTRGGLAVWTKVLAPEVPAFAVGSDRRVVIEQPIEVLIERRHGQP